MRLWSFLPYTMGGDLWLGQRPRGAAESASGRALRNGMPSFEGSWVKKGSARATPSPAHTRAASLYYSLFFALFAHLLKKGKSVFK